MKTNKLLAGILLGAAAGAVLGILFAPDKGKETRKKLKNKGQELGDKLSAWVGAQNVTAFQVGEQICRSRSRTGGDGSRHQVGDHVGAVVDVVEPAPAVARRAC